MDVVRKRACRNDLTESRLQYIVFSSPVLRGMTELGNSSLNSDFRKGSKGK